ncbi:MAG TPA: GFA family protein [Bradyrhizobium sp.]|nr:GFA family protein [Bradyrhizobium sp.]
MVYTCSCTNCQTASGSAFALNMPVQTNGFRIIKGELKGWRYLSPRGIPVVSWFCGECGARIYGERSTRPDSINLRAGTLDDTRWLVPVAHLFRTSAQGWVQPAPGADCYEMEPDDFRPLAKKWRAIWQD